MDKPPLPTSLFSPLNRRDLLAAAAASPALLVGGHALAAPAKPVGLAKPMGFPPVAPGGANLDQIADEFFTYLEPLRDAVKELAHTWRPSDPAYRADLFRQIMMNLSFGYFVYFNADAEHPDWSPLYNPVFACQPNPDDIYLFSPIRSDLTYRVSGNRGTVSKFIFVTEKGIPGTGSGMDQISAVTMFDEQDFTVGADGHFEIIISAKRPAGYTGNWFELKPGADVIFSRYRMVNWETEVDPQMTIECLDKVGPKRRLTPEQIRERVKLVATVPGNQNRIFFQMQNVIIDHVGLNAFDPVRLTGIGTRQVYWPAVFQFDEGEALIIETDMPKVRPYWNIQLNDELFNAVEYVYRSSHLNAWNSYISGDGRLRAVISLTDPGVANWLDPAGFREGTIYGRWYDCDTSPTPIIKRVPLAQLRSHLPKDTPSVSPEQRDDLLRRRILAAQRRRRW
jgi:hypothetical protein